MRTSKRSGLLITESARDFSRVRKELSDEIQPTGAIERMHVDDIAWLTFEIQRLRRSRAELWNTALLAALENLLKQLLLQENFETPLKREYAAKHLARHYFDDRQVRAEVAALLRGVQLTEAAIEAEAFRLRAEDLERIDRMLALAMARRDKTLCSIAEFRHALAKLLHQASDRIIEHDSDRTIEYDQAPRVVASVKCGG